MIASLKMAVTSPAVVSLDGLLLVLRLLDHLTQVLNNVLPQIRVAKDPLLSFNSVM